MKTISRYFSNLSGGRYAQIHITPAPNCSLFQLIPLDVWMIIVTEWMDQHVRNLLILEYAMGRKEREKWIYTTFKRLSVPCYVSMNEVDAFFEWKQCRGLEYIDQLTIICRSESITEFPWQKLCPMKKFAISVADMTRSHITNNTTLHQLFQQCPGLHSLELPLEYLKVSSSTNDPMINITTIEPLLKHLTITNHVCVTEQRWYKILQRLSFISPNLETLNIQHTGIGSFPILLHAIEGLHTLKSFIVSFQRPYGDYENDSDYDVEFQIPNFSFSNRLYALEKVTLEEEHDKTLFTMLLHCPCLQELRITSHIRLDKTITQLSEGFQSISMHRV